MDLLPRICCLSEVSFLSRALRYKSVYTPYSFNFFIRRYRLLLVVPPSVAAAAIAATEYPALNMLTALRGLALKASLVIVSRIYARVHSRVRVKLIHYIVAWLVRSIFPLH